MAQYRPCQGSAAAGHPRRPARCCTTRRSATSAGRSGCRPAAGARDLRRGGGRGRAGGAVGGGLCGVRGADRSRCSTRSATAGRPAPACGSRTTSAFRPGSPARRWPGRACVQAEKFGAEIIYPVCVKRARLPRAGRPLPARVRRRRRGDGAHGGDRQRRALPAAGDPGDRAVRGARGLVLGLAARGEDVRRRGGGAGRRRQLGRAGGGLPRGACVEGEPADPRRRPAARACRATSSTGSRRRRTSSSAPAARWCGSTATRRGISPGSPGTAASTGDDSDRPIRNLFLFVGADPETSWVRPCALKLDRNGFVLTGAAVPGRGAGQAAARGEPARGLRDRRRAGGLGQARRRRDRRGRGGGRAGPRGAGGGRRGLTDGLGSAATGLRRLLRVLARPVRRARGRRGVVLQPYRGYGSAARIFVIGRAFWQRTERGRGQRAARRPAAHPAPAGARGADPGALLRGGRSRSRPTATAISASRWRRASRCRPRCAGTGWRSRCWRRRGWRRRPRSTCRRRRRGSSWSPTSTTR